MKSSLTRTVFLTVTFGFLISNLPACKKDKSPVSEPEPGCKLLSYTWQDSLLYEYKTDGSDKLQSVKTINLYTHDSSIVYYSYSGNQILISDGNKILLNDRNLNDSQIISVNVGGQPFPGYIKNFYNSNDQKIREIIYLNISSTELKITYDFIYASDILASQKTHTESNLGTDEYSTTVYSYDDKLEDQSKVWMNKYFFYGKTDSKAVKATIQFTSSDTSVSQYFYKHVNGKITEKFVVTDSQTSNKYNYNWNCH